MTVTRGFAAWLADAEATARSAAATTRPSVQARTTRAGSGSRRRRRLLVRVGIAVVVIRLRVLFDGGLVVLVDLVVGDDLGEDTLRLGALLLGDGDGGSLRLGLGSLDRQELLLGRKLSALGDDVRRHLDLDVLEELDRDREAADPLERIRGDLPPVDADLPRPPDLVGDVG